MIKKAIVFLLFLGFYASVFAQNKHIEFKTEANGSTLSFYGYNNMSRPLDITLSLSELKDIQGYSAPITKQVPAYSKLVFLKVKTTSEDYTYNTKFTFKVSKKATKSDRQIAYEKRLLSTDKQKFQLKDKSKINQGIVVFDDGHCGRTQLVTNYLIGNNIDFKIVSTENNPKNVKFMWKTLKEKGASLDIKTPVIVVNGHISHSHEDLNGFLESLK